MNITIQEVSLKDFSITVGDDFLQSRIALGGSKGEMILVLCAIGDLVTITGAFSRAVLADLVRRGEASEATDALMHRKTAASEEQVAARIQVIGEGAAHALVANTLEDTQLLILLMPAQRDAVLQGLA